MTLTDGEARTFAVGTGVIIAKRRHGVVLERDGAGGMTVRWDDGEVTTIHPYALAHERRDAPRSPSAT